MITDLQVTNFKSLSEFVITGLGKFICLVGLNGAGKTTLLQAIDFIGRMSMGDGDFRTWGKTELLTIGSASRTCGFSVTIRTEAQEPQRLKWSGKYNVDRQRFVEESIVDETTEPHTLLLQVRDGKLYELSLAPDGDRKNIRSISDYNYRGSVLAAIKFQSSSVNCVKEALQSLKSLELLSPHALRRASQDADAIDIGGGGLAGYLSKLGPAETEHLRKKLSEFYPEVVGYDIKKKKFGWRRLSVSEAMLKNPISATHVNDGLLRMIAILSQRYNRQQFVLFDEIENGINQEVIGRLVAELTDFNGKQVMVTTHSPLVMNYLADDQAKASVYFLYKDRSAHTHARRFFEIPGIADRLKFLGPGEIMGNTDLIRLAAEITSGGRESCDSIS